MAKKPILTDDELDGGMPSRGAPPPPLPRQAGSGAGVTRPLDTPQASSGGTATRIVADDAPDTPAPASTGSAEPMQGRDASGHARPKTRIHGYGGEAASQKDDTAPMADETMVAPVVGWLVVTAGPGRGASVGLTAGMNGVGRGSENNAQVDFGDDTISREPHAYVTYDDETRRFHLSHGGKTNLVRLNDAPVLTAETLSHGDTIRIGATALRFVALCGPDFDWNDA